MHTLAIQSTSRNDGRISPTSCTGQLLATTECPSSLFISLCSAWIELYAYTSSFNVASLLVRFSYHPSTQTVWEPAYKIQVHYLHVCCSPTRAWALTGLAMAAPTEYAEAQLIELTTEPNGNALYTFRLNTCKHVVSEVLNKVAGT